MGVYLLLPEKTRNIKPNNTTVISELLNSSTPTPAKTQLQIPPPQKILPTNYHIFQSFNNCGPAALSMALSHYGITKTQEELGQSLRPYQIANGDNDDKSVTLDELAEKAKEYNLIPYHRPNGSIDLVKRFIASDIPVIARTWLHPNEDIGHFRVIKGYDDSTQEIIQDDSFEGHDLRYKYSDFNGMWGKFSYEYLALVPKGKEQIAQAILATDFDKQLAWERAVKNAEKELAKNPQDTYSRFNLSVALYNTKDYQKSVIEFEKVENQLPFRTLWYQIEPIQAYYEIGDYHRVFAITDQILNNQNRAFSELYIIRGKIYQKQGEIDSAKHEFEKAVLYNSNLKEAKEALNSL